jgi:hypothetical protein
LLALQHERNRNMNAEESKILNYLAILVSLLGVVSGEECPVIRRLSQYSQFDSKRNQVY